MSKVKTGDVLNCEVCGLAVVVDEDCGCAAAEIICCDEPMVNKGPAAPKKKVAAKVSAKKAAVKKIKSAAGKKAAKPAAKKQVVKKKAVKKATKK
ncbi:MAG TPA: hypothetical protein PK114_01155 [Smithellaceae bacterium]|nr:hypothetical protein [Smithellaceae bacterium]